jgi:hypothetical protein
MFAFFQVLALSVAALDAPASVDNSDLDRFCPAGTPQRQEYDAFLQKTGVMFSLDLDFSVGKSWVISILATIIGHLNFKDGHKLEQPISKLWVSVLFGMIHTALIAYPVSFAVPAYTRCLGRSKRGDPGEGARSASAGISFAILSASVIAFNINTLNEKDLYSTGRSEIPTEMLTVIREKIPTAFTVILPMVVVIAYYAL